MGMNKMPKSVVLGGFKYFWQMSPAAGLDTVLKLPSCCLRPFDIGPLLSIDQALIVFDRELGINRKPDGLILVRTLPRQLDRKLDSLAAILRSHVGGELIRIEHLPQQRSKLHFTPRPTGLDVREYLLKVTDAGRKRLHLPKPLVHLFQTFADLFEGFTQTLFQRPLQFLVHGLPHLVKLFGVVDLHALESVFHRDPDCLQFSLI